MIEKILAPLDGTETAEAAIPLVEHLGSSSGAAIHLLAAVDGKSPGEESTESGGNGHQTLAAYLRTRQASLQEKGLRAEMEVVRGSAAELILARAEAQSADVTVMTYGTSRWVFGSVLDKVLQGMTRPVLIVRGQQGAVAEQINGSNRILVPLDKSDYSSQVLAIARQMAQGLRMTIVLCHTISPLGDHRDPDDAPLGVARAMEGLLEEARALLSRAADSLAGEIAVETLTAFGQADEEIPRIAERTGAGLIAMTTRGRERLDSRIMGSVANSVVQRTKVPCLLTRPQPTS